MDVFYVTLIFELVGTRAIVEIQYGLYTILYFPCCFLYSISFVHFVFTSLMYEYSYKLLNV